MHVQQVLMRLMQQTPFFQMSIFSLEILYLLPISLIMDVTVVRVP